MLKFLKNDNKKKSIDDGQGSDKLKLDDAEKIVIGDGIADYAQQQQNSKKKLHRNLKKILNDRLTLSSFVQYLETKNGLPLVKFWLDVETFKSVGGCNDSSERTESRISNYDNIAGSRKERNYDCVSISTTATSNTSNFDESEEINGGEDEVDRAAEGNFDQSLTDDEKMMKNKKIEEETKVQQPTIILEDALRIYRKYLVTDSVYSLELPPILLGKLSLALCGSDTETEAEINNLWMAFDEAQQHVFELMEREYLTEFLDSPFYAKYTVDVLTSDSLCLEEILCSESALFYFMEFLEQENKEKLPYLEFWLSATNFQKQSIDGDDTLKSDALVIYEKWFSLQATTPLNFSNRVRTKVEELICSGDQACFDVPIKIVELFLEKNCLNKFIKSQLFFKHLSEVMCKLDQIEPRNNSGIIRRNSSYAQSTNGNKSSKNKHRRTNSENLKMPQKSISTQNTLLAGLDYNHKKKTDLQIDSRQILDPDMLWRRNNSNVKLSFGRVDAFGRYERDFEMPNNSQQPQIIPSSKSFQGTIDVDDPQSIFEQAKWSSLKNAMRKLVHLPEDSVQQEIAWQVAEMIIKDVTSITMQQQESDTINGERSS